jgi:hypothetical protein
MAHDERAAVDPDDHRSHLVPRSAVDIELDATAVDDLVIIRLAQLVLRVSGRPGAASPRRPPRGPTTREKSAGISTVPRLVSFTRGCDGEAHLVIMCHTTESLCEKRDRLNPNDLGCPTCLSGGMGGRIAGVRSVAMNVKSHTP